MSILTSFEIQSSAWVKIREELESRLDSCRKKNDAVMLSDLETANLRGEIRCLKNLLALGDQSPGPTLAEDDV